MVESPVVANSDSEVYSIDVVEYFVLKKKYEDREEMINCVCCHARKA